MYEVKLLDEERKAIWRTLQAMENAVALIKASGGYRYREPLRLTDTEFAERLDQAFGRLKAMAVSWPIAESMLAEYGHRHEYQARRMHALQEIDREAREKRLARRKVAFPRCEPA